MIERLAKLPEVLMGVNDNAHGTIDWRFPIFRSLQIDE